MKNMICILMLLCCFSLMGNNNYSLDNFGEDEAEAVELYDRKGTDFIFDFGYLYGEFGNTYNVGIIASFHINKTLDFEFSTYCYDHVVFFLYGLTLNSIGLKYDFSPSFAVLGGIGFDFITMGDGFNTRGYAGAEFRFGKKKRILLRPVVMSPDFANPNGFYFRINIGARYAAF